MHAMFKDTNYGRKRELGQENEPEFNVMDFIETEFYYHQYEASRQVPSSYTVPDNVWTGCPYPPPIMPFTATPGLQIPTPSSPLDFLQIFITRELLLYFTNETNNYAKELCVKYPSMDRNWYDVSLEDMGHFFGLTIIMGICRMPRVDMHWRVGTISHTPAFNQCMPRKRYQQINTCFSSYNNKAIPKGNKDSLIKIRTVMEYLQRKAKEVYMPERDLSLDKGGMPWRGHLSFKGSNPKKTEEYGIKMIMVAESGTGYVYNFIIYSGLSPKTQTPVMDLVGGLAGKGYRIYLNNFESSLTLAEELQKKGFHCCGTSNLVQDDTPSEFQDIIKNKMSLDRTVFTRKGNVFIICWQESQEKMIKLITTLHNAEAEEVMCLDKTKSGGKVRISTRVSNRPAAIADYDKNKGGVGHIDHIIQHYPFTRKNYRWTKKMVYYLMQMAIHNSYVLYKKYSNDTRKMTFLEFTEFLCQKLVYFDEDEWPASGDTIPHAPDLPNEGYPVSSIAKTAQTSTAATANRPSPFSWYSPSAFTRPSPFPGTSLSGRPPFPGSSTHFPGTTHFPGSAHFPGPGHFSGSGNFHGAAGSQGTATSPGTYPSSSESPSPSSANMPPPAVPSSSTDGRGEQEQNQNQSQDQGQGKNEEKSEKEKPARPEGARPRRPRVVDSALRLRKDLRHNIGLIPGGKWRRCRVCTKAGKRKDTKYFCETCDIPLCTLCFSPYHTKTCYWK